MLRFCYCCFLLAKCRDFFPSSLGDIKVLLSFQSLQTMGAWNPSGTDFKKQIPLLLDARWGVKAKWVLAYNPSPESGSLYPCLLNSALSVAPPFSLLCFVFSKVNTQSQEAFHLLCPHADKIKELDNFWLFCLHEVQPKKMLGAAYQLKPHAS